MFAFANRRINPNVKTTERRSGVKLVDVGNSNKQNPVTDETTESEGQKRCSGRKKQKNDTMQRSVSFEVSIYSSNIRYKHTTSRIPNVVACVKSI